MSMDNHSRSIIHIDIDCFYAQVETLKNPRLINQPVGIQQKQIVVTSNYIARRYGIEKCMLVSDALKLCPHLALVNGEDLKDYRNVSYKLTGFLQRYTGLVERLGMDENYLDVSAMVSERLNANSAQWELKGCVLDDDSMCDERCTCGCYERLVVASNIALEIRNAVNDELKLTTCAGVAHNKLLAKLASNVNKPNQQTVIFPHNAFGFISSLEELLKIPGIGKTTEEQLSSNGITTIKALQDATIEQLTKILSYDKSKYLKGLCVGVDETPVKSSGKPQSIGLEDSCKPLTLRDNVHDKLSHLLRRLMLLVQEDGRLPTSIKLTIRQIDRISHRETKQCNLNQNLFTIDKNCTIVLSDANQQRLMAIVMSLFTKIVDINRPFHVTLLGLAFTKFRVVKNSLVQFLKPNVEVQTITDIINEDCESIMDVDVNLNSKVDKLHIEEPAAKRLKINNANNTTTSVHCPPNLEENVFRELPVEIQRELWDNYLVNNNRTSKPPKPKVNTLHNYFHKK